MLLVAFHATNADAQPPELWQGLRLITGHCVTLPTRNVSFHRLWANLDLIGSQETWKKFGTGGDAKGQPTQTNSISHGSPYIRIKKIMVGANA